MTTITVKIRKSTVDSSKCKMYYQIINRRVTRQVSTKYQLLVSEWNPHLCRVITDTSDAERRYYLMEIQKKIDLDLCKFKNVVRFLERDMENYTADDVVEGFRQKSYNAYLFAFMREVIRKLRAENKLRTSETYQSALNSFMKYRNGKDILLEMLDSDVMIMYESWLKSQKITMNTISFYNRILRAVYNRAVERGIISQRYPFRHVYTGVGKTVKRAVDFKTIKRIKSLDLSGKPALEFARDMFLFSFYTRGMAFVDLAYLKKRDLSGGVLKYRRRKTGQQLLIKWEPCMQELVKKYNNDKSPYMLPIICHEKKDERKQYLNQAHNVNQALKIIGGLLNLSIPLTFYVARHAWASIAKSKRIPLSIISEGMGHDSELTTRIYLASLDTSEVDKANHLMLKDL